MELSLLRGQTSVQVLMLKSSIRKLQYAKSMGIEIDLGRKKGNKEFFTSKIVESIVLL